MMAHAALQTKRYGDKMLDQIERFLPKLVLAPTFVLPCYLFTALFYGPAICRLLRPECCPIMSLWG